MKMSEMAFLTTLPINPSFLPSVLAIPFPPPRRHLSKHFYFTFGTTSDNTDLSTFTKSTKRKMSQFLTKTTASPNDLIGPLLGAIYNPPSWQSAILSNVVIFVLGYPILITGLSFSGIAAAFLLGTLTWRAFGPSGFLLVATYFVIGTAATKVKMAQKEAQGVAEKRKGRRGPGSVIGSSAAGCVCAFLSISGVGGKRLSPLWQLGFVASFCTKLSDTVSSEIGKAYGRTTYLVTTFKIVPRGTEGAVSVEGTFAGLLASILLSFVGCLTGQINATESVVCVLASQLANLGESVIGASLQEKEGFQWLNNDVVNIINISMGSILAVTIQQILLRSWPR
ncbi:hypothetical protein Nepgr_027430 [Nepenthes gracilis]|uniref:Protein VTE6, chloroplastic n=1 Tax=Nepenthes gracilis TaxID=150966 RepID=A0AAD3Y185_NEPGR|nr:hypothetical protein Nepgr_027430 [Nepenthes gracilis]